MTPLPTATETRSTCAYCGVGCGVIITSAGGRITSVRGDPDHPANAGKLCTKGATLHLSASPEAAQQTRLLSPMVRPQRNAAPTPVPWDDALNHVADRLADIVRSHGPDAVGFYVSGQLLTEDYYLFNKLAKGLLGTNNIDTNSRLCMSSAVAGYKQSLGADAPPACYDDIDHAQCLFISGSNTAWAHPVLFRRIEAARDANPAQKMVVVDPRRTETAAMADLHLAIQPGTDIALYNGMLHLMRREGWLDDAFVAAHTQGWAELQAVLDAHPPELVAQICGISLEDLYTATQWFAQGPTLSLYCQGLNQSVTGTANNTALINLHLATGQVGRVGAGPFSLTGQPNAMGGREVGGLANLLSAHRDLRNPAHRAEVAAFWGVPDVPGQPGLTALDLFKAAAQGRVKALWIVCTNPAESMPHQTLVRQALSQAELVIVQDAFATSATCTYADVLLPATTWGEKEGTVTNSERRISRVRPAVPPPQGADGQSPRHDWAIAAAVAQRLEARLPRRSAQTLFDHPHPEAIWREHRDLTAGRDLDITALSYAQLDAAPVQWPCTASAPQGTVRLYTDGQFATDNGRARFVATPYRSSAEHTDSHFPFALTTGRLRDQWHTQTRTGLVGKLWSHSPSPCVQMHPDDLRDLALQAHDLVRLTSRRGDLILPVQPVADLGRKQVFVAMHWGDDTLGGQQRNGQASHGINTLTTDASCPDSHQPAFKLSAVRIEKVHLPWRLLALAWLPTSSVWTVQQAWRAHLGAFAHATCVPFAHPERPDVMGLLLSAAHPSAPADAGLACLHTLHQTLALDDPATLRYDDTPRHTLRRLRVSAPEHPDTLVLTGAVRSMHWVVPWFQSGAALGASASRLLQDLPIPPSNGTTALSPIVCNCVGVRAQAIQDTLDTATGDAPTRLQLLQTQLGCGSQCGSCVPALKRMIQTVMPQTQTCS